MNYPLISEYIEAIKAAKDNFEKLTNLRAVLGDDDPKVETFSIYIGEGKNKGVVVKKGTFDKSVRDRICDYVNR